MSKMHVNGRDKIEILFQCSMTEYGHYSSQSYYFPQGFCIAVYTPDFLPHDMSQGPEFIFSTT